MCVPLTAWIALVLPAFPQESADEVALALLRRETGAAARAAARVESPALHARLQAALLPAAERAAAMLAVARAFPAEVEADRALVAGAAAALDAAARAEAVPELAAWADVEGSSDTDAERLSPIVVGLRDVLAARRATGGDPELQQEAERLLSLASVTRFGLRPARIPIGAPWRRPREQREPLELRLAPCEPGRLSWTQLDRLGAPAWTATLPVAGPVALPAIPAGDWLLEARSTTSPWRGVRRVLASDLEPVVLRQDGCLALAAFDPHGAATARWELWQSGVAVEHGEVGAAPALVRLREETVERVGTVELRLRGERGTAWLDHHGVSHDEAASTRWLVHAMVDRPVYRPGETVRGRLVLRTCRWDGEHFSAVPTTAPAANVPLTLVRDRGASDAEKQPLCTDAHGLASFSFVVPAETLPGHEFDLALELPETNAKGEPLLLGMRDLCGVADFRRQAVRLAIDGPAAVPPDADHVDVVARAEWSSGGPAAGLDVKAAIRAGADWAREEAAALRTDAEGRVTVRVPIASVRPRWVDVEFTVLGPDGKAVAERHGFEVAARNAADVKPGAARWLADPVPSIELDEATVGAACHVALHGRPGLRVLVVVGRSRNARVRSVTLDAAGEAAFDEPVLRCDWPRFDVAAATVAGRDDRSVPVRLRPMREPTLEVPEQAEPGRETTVRAHGDAPGALVTFAVVDERIYELAADRTEDPEDAFWPWLPDPRWDPFVSPSTTTPGDLLDSLLVHGRLPRLGLTRDLSAGSAGGGAGGGSGGRSGGAAARSRFSPTAHFATVVADENGDAATTFRLPDDLTRWRVTAVVVEPDGMGAIVTKSFASRQPLAAEPVLPRALRAGDAFQLPLVIDRSSDASGPDVAIVTAAAQGESLAVDRARTELAVPAGRVVPMTLPMRAVAAGDATLRLAVDLGQFTDRSERGVTVGPDRVARPLAAAGAGTGAVTVSVPESASTDAPLTLDVLQGGAEAWRLLEADLANYPYGCAEQTLSRLLPRFSLLRAARARGEEPPPLGAEFEKRLRMGLAHLRALQPDSSGRFAFWPGERPERGITGLVLHGLAVLRDGGFELARSGLDLRDESFRDALPTRDGVHVVDAEFVMAVEELAGAVRLFPKDQDARELLSPALELLPALPAGLCARMGLALHGAGDVAGARACRQRLSNGALPALQPSGFPGEDPLAIQALRLELDAALGEPSNDVQRGAAELLLACLSGRGTTYGRACALSTLAIVLPRTEAKPGVVDVEAGSERRELALGGPAGAAVRLRMPHAGAVTVRGPAGMPLLVRVTTERSERASDHPAWATPIHVARQWCDPRPDATWEQRRDGTDLVPHAGPLVLGRPLVLRLVVESPVPMRHVVVDCPLPAGFELPNDVEGIERFDDRVAFACDLAANAPCVLRLEVVPTAEGRFVWPPASAVPMYCSDNDGGTAGAFVEVAAVPSSGLSSFALGLQGPNPEVIDAPTEPLDEWCRTFDAAFDDAREPDHDVASHLLRGSATAWETAPIWGESGPDEETRAHLVEASWSTLPPADADRPQRLESLTDLLARLNVTEDDGLFAERAWRVAAHARLQGIVMELAITVLAAPWPSEPEAAMEHARRLGRTLGLCPTSPPREALLARWWRKARACELADDDLLELVRTSPEDPELRAAVREIATTTKGEAFGRAWSLLSRDDRAALPAGLVLGACARDEAGVIGVLAENDAGREELRRRLAVPGFVLSHFARLEAELPAALWADVPLAVFAGLATAAIANEQDVTVDAVLAHLADRAFSTATLQRELATTKVPAWRSLLAQALRARGAPAGDGAPAAWAQALALAADDVVGARVLLVAERRKEHGLDLAGELALLADFVAPIFVGHATPDQLYEAREWLDTNRRREAWARRTSRDRVALLEHFQEHVDGSFVPASDDEAEALWRFVLRSGDVEAPVQALLQSGAGIDCLRRHLQAGDAGDHDEALREAYAWALEVDETTLEPHLGEELPALLARLVRRGFAGPFSAEDAARVRRLRRLRGV